MRIPLGAPTRRLDGGAKIAMGIRLGERRPNV
jgi:hypothetical protein